MIRDQYVALSQVMPVWLLVLLTLTVFSQPFGVSHELFTLIMMLLGLHDLSRNHLGCRQRPAVHFFSLLFLCFWLPGLVALPDAVNMKTSLVDTFGLLRFYFAGVFIVNRIYTYEHVRYVSYAIAAVVLFWVADAWLQSLSGRDIFGITTPYKGRVSGPFGDDPVIGWMLVLYLGVTVAAVWQRRIWALTVFSVLGLLSVIVISGNRAAWLAVMWVVGAFICVMWLWQVKISRRWIVIAVIGGVVLAAGLTQHPAVKKRLALIGEASQMSYEAWDAASSYRLTLWDTSLGMIAANPLNGVGVKGFRYAYPEYTTPDDYYLSENKYGQIIGAYHAHQIVLEALAETGIVGLAGLLMAFWLVFVRLFQRIAATKAILPLGYWLGLVGVLFPVNTHLSLFSSYWAQAVWFMVALTVAATFTACKDSSSPVGAS